MKLNNRGILLVPFLFFISIFAFCLIYSTYRLHDLGLIKDIWPTYNPKDIE